MEELLKQSRISTSIWDLSAIDPDGMGEYMLGQDGMGIDLRGFDFGQGWMNRTYVVKL
jgi:hypothetical protein